MKVRFIGIGIPQSRDFISERPHGSGDYDLLFVRSPAFFELGGERLRTEPDTMILYRPESRQYYGAVGDGYRDDFIHFTFEDDGYLLGKYAIPADTLIRIGNPQAIETLFRQLQNERIGNGSRSAEAVDLLMQVLLLKISENLTRGGTADDKYYQDFVELRSSVYSRPSAASGVTDMAEKLGISTSYFHMKYRGYFGVTPAEDFIRAKIGFACHLLRNTSKSVRQVSAESGYDCEPHFMRQFRQRTGMTPATYRRVNTRR